MKKTLTLISILLFGLSVNGKTILKSGSLDFLKGHGQKLFKVEFSYDKLIMNF